MPSPVDREARRGLIQRFVSGLSFPKLFFFLSGLFLLDLAVPDMIPFLDEAILGTLTVLVGTWREKRARRGSGA
ncbi:MAG: DUF6116 family protein [Vicinamibacteria bacterium]